MRRICLDCGQYLQHQARGLCGHCYYLRKKAGTLDHRPPLSDREGWGTTETLVAEAGISYRQLDFWVRRGYLRPDNATPGSGSARKWSAEERRTAILMARLVAAGIRPSEAHRVARGGELAPGIRVHFDDEAVA